MNEKIKKNILDLTFQKYLVIASTSIVLIFTYFIALSIAFITRQIELTSFSIMFRIFILSSAVLSSFLFMFFKSTKNLKKIIETIKILKV